MGLVHAGMAQHGTVVFTHEQTKGKGQRGKQWVATANENIMMTLVVNPFTLPLEEQFLLSMSTAVGVQRFFSFYAGEETTIKWPNDLYWRDRKAGGILIENLVKGKEWKFAIIGIGININQTSFSHTGRTAVSLRQITGKTFDTVVLAKELITFLEDSFGELQANRNQVLPSYESVLYKRQQRVRLKKGTRVFETTVKGVHEDGRLVTGEDIEEYFAVGEVEWVL